MNPEALAPYIIFETRHWVVNHRRDARYPGYLMVSSRAACGELHELDADTLGELGNVLKRVEILLRDAYAPMKVVFYKLGFSPGFSCHFHAAPVTAALLAEVVAHPGYADDPDGNDVILFLSRVYCERALRDHEIDDQRQVIQRLKSLCGHTPGTMMPPV